jgi:tetratricopeptide (TPR) repeat protein
MLVSLLLVFSFYNFLFDRDEKHNDKFVQAMSDNNFIAAKNSIEKTSKRTPYLINRSLVHWCLYKETGDSGYLAKSKEYLIEAHLLNPNDLVLKYNLSIILESENKSDSSLCILEELTEKYPNNSLYQAGLFLHLYKNEKKEEGKKHFISAVENEPNLLETSVWRKMQEKDSIYADQISGEIHDRLLNTEVNDPVSSARYGRLLLCLKDTLSAKSFLQSSVAKLPNLSMPWYHLACIAYKENNSSEGDLYHKKAMLFQINTYPSKEPSNDRTHNYPYKFFSKEYLLKFQRWYQRNCNEII